jgi:hypothetical protein
MVVRTDVSYVHVMIGAGCEDGGADVGMWWLGWDDVTRAS